MRPLRLVRCTLLQPGPSEWHLPQPAQLMFITPPYPTWGLGLLVGVQVQQHALSNTSWRKTSNDISAAWAAHAVHWRHHATCCMRPSVSTSNSAGSKEFWWATIAHLQHGPRMLCIGGGVPHVPRGQSLRHCLPGVCHEAFPLHIHAMLLVPCRARPASRKTRIVCSCQRMSQLLSHAAGTLTSDMCQQMTNILPPGEVGPLRIAVAPSLI